MLALAGHLAMAVAARCKHGGVIVNEHSLTGAETQVHVAALSRWFDLIDIKDVPVRLERPGRRPFCVLTFDDGKRSNYTETASELERLGVPATFYVITSFIGGTAPLWFDSIAALEARLKQLPPELAPPILKRLPYHVLTQRVERALNQHGVRADMSSENIRPMTWDEVRGLHRRGFTIGAHGHVHSVLTCEERNFALNTIAESIDVVSRETGAACRTFAFPNGNYTAELARHAAACGAETVVTTEPVWVNSSYPPWRLPRLQLFPRDSEPRIESKLAAAATGRILSNPDGTGTVYRNVQALSRKFSREKVGTENVPPKVPPSQSVNAASGT